MVSAPSSDVAFPSPLLPSLPVDQKYFSIAQAATLFGVSRVSVWRWIRSGRLPATQIGPRSTRIYQEDIERLLIARESLGQWPWGYRGSESPALLSDSSALAPQIDWSAIGSSEHFVQFFEEDPVMLDAVSGYFGVALRAHEVAIAIATPEHLAGIEHRLRRDGFDIARPDSRSQYRGLDAAALLFRFMIDGSPDPDLFTSVMDEVLAPVVHSGQRVRVFGEMVALLAMDGNHAAAVRLESLWNALQERYSFVLFCAYSMASVGGAYASAALADVCALHTRVIPAESYTALPGPDARMRAVIALQQKAQSLEAALAAELAARQLVEDALRVREDFLSIASHELRTPLTTLSGHAQMTLRQLARDGEVPTERVARSLQIIGKQAEKLTRLINQLTDVSRLEAGKAIAVDRARTDLSTLVEGVLDSARALSSRHAITASVSASLEADVDALRFEQVLTNLLDNAVKYSPGGGPVEVQLTSDGAGHVEFSVRDHGSGIPIERREHLFERYYQAHADSNRSGLGLGLYLSRQIVDAHNGSIRAEFPKDGGTRFVVRLPVACMTGPKRSTR